MVDNDEAHRSAEAIRLRWPESTAIDGGALARVPVVTRGRERERERPGGGKAEKQGSERRERARPYPREVGSGRGSGSRGSSELERLGRYRARGGRRPVGFAPRPLPFPFSCC